MLFNSFLYMFIFLPIVFTLYFYLASYANQSSKLFLIGASFLFYGWWNLAYIKLLAISILVNYAIALVLKHQCIEKDNKRKLILAIGIVFNIALLGYFKYTNFCIVNTNALLNVHYKLREIILPLGISFFTFTQTAFIVDAYKRTVKNYNLMDYALFVSYFPHLLAGPIIHHADVMPQFNEKKNNIINYKNVYLGIVLFVIGLTKKVVIADTFSIFANQGYANVGHLSFSSAWVTSLAYTFQLYFDFSGYTDMAIGVSKALNINLPLNFNSPYKSTSIQEFWRRWHITLSHFLRDYIYIPLGGNKVNNIKIYANLLMTFLIGGFWHGAGWTFVFWGFLHGMALCVQRVFRKLHFTFPTLLSWLLTFIFVNFAWIFFRADTLHDAFYIISCMVNINKISVINPIQLFMLATALLVVKFAPNSNQISESRMVSKVIFVPVISTFFLLSVFAMEIIANHEFIYFQF